MTGLGTGVAPHRVVRLARLAGWTRVAFGASFVLAPRATARPWIASAVDTPGTQLLARSVGIRDSLLGVGLLRALNRADRQTAATWLAHGAAAGVVDAAATLAVYSGLPRSGRTFLLLIIGALGADAGLAANLRHGSTEVD